MPKSKHALLRVDVLQRAFAFRPRFLPYRFATPLQDIATSLRTASNQLVFLLSCGYFEATKRFYAVPTFHRRDLTYVGDRIAVTLEGLDLTDYPKQTMSRHQAAILNFYGFRALVQSHLKPKLIFPRALDVSVREKLEVPGIFPLKGAKDPYILFPASFRLVLKSHPRRAIDIYSRLGGWGRSGRAKSSKLCKAIARRPALRSRSTRICSAIRC